jgi:hypothetical protein
MPLTVSFQYGSSTPVSVTFGLTIARAKALTLRYAKRHGLVQEGMTETQIGEAVINHLMRSVADETASVHRQELIASQLAGVEATVTLDNTLNP